MKYHVNSNTGRAGQCRATKKGCPLGADTPHFDTKEEAKAYIEKSEAASNEKFTSMSKKGSSGGSGSGKDKTLVGTPEPDNGGEMSEKLSTALKDIKDNADFIVSKGARETPYNEGVRNASERISQYHDEAFKDGYNRAALDKFKSLINVDSAMTSMKGDAERGDDGELDGHTYGELVQLDAQLDYLDMIEKNEAKANAKEEELGVSVTNAYGQTVTKNAGKNYVVQTTVDADGEEYTEIDFNNGGRMEFGNYHNTPALSLSIKH